MTIMRPLSGYTLYSELFAIILKTRLKSKNITNPVLQYINVIQ
jgi:hypothetical protein